MPQILPFKFHVLLSKHSLFLYPILKMKPLVQNPNFATKFPFFRCSFSHSRKTDIQKPIVCAKRTKRRSGYQRSTKFMLQLVSILASNLKILPQPLDLVIQEFNGGDGGGLGFLRRFGGGGGFGWWRRSKKGCLGFLVILSSMFLFFGRELRSDIFCGVLSLCFLGLILVKGFKRNVQNWIFGLCCFASLIGLRLKREQAMKLIDEFRVYAPMVEILTKSKRRGRRRSL